MLCSDLLQTALSTSVGVIVSIFLCLRGSLGGQEKNPRDHLSQSGKTLAWEDKGRFPLTARLATLHHQGHWPT